MRHAVRRVGLALALALLTLWWAAPALAHALLVRSNPSADVVLKSTPTQIHLWFSEDLNGAASKIVVWDRDRHPQQVGSPHLVPGQPRQLEVRLRPGMAGGAYLVLWTSVSAEDGHVLRGSYIFFVKHRGPGPSLAGVSLGGEGQTFPDGPTLLSLLAHWLELLGATVWVGAAFLSAIVLRPLRQHLGELSDMEARRSRLLVLDSICVLALSSLIVVLVQIYQSGGNTWSALTNGDLWSAELTADYGRLWIGRYVLVLVTLLLLAIGRSRRWKSVSIAVLGVGLAYLALFAASGHGASAEIGTVAGSPLISLSVGADWLHFIADSLWLGGQIAIAAVLLPVLRGAVQRRTLDPLLAALTRFGYAAYASIGLYVVSGAFAAKVHIPSWYAYFNSIYGRTLIVKMALIGAMMLVSAFTVYILRPGLKRALASHDTSVTQRSSGLFGWLRVNPILGAGVLLATSVMFYYPVPLGFGPPGPSAYHVAGHGLAATVRITPDKAGPNRIEVHLSDGQGHPVARAGITVITTMLDMPMGSGLAPLHPGPGGTFSGTTDLGMGGRWRLTLLIYRPGGAYIRLPVEVRVGV